MSDGLSTAAPDLIRRVLWISLKWFGSFLWTHRRVICFVGALIGAFCVPWALLALYPPLSYPNEYVTGYEYFGELVRSLWDWILPWRW